MGGQMFDRNDYLLAAARAVTPGGVNSPVRAYGSVGGTPRFLASARGATGTDAAGGLHLDLAPPSPPRPRAPRGRRGGAGGRSAGALVRSAHGGRGRTRATGRRPGAHRRARAD